VQKQKFTLHNRVSLDEDGGDEGDKSPKKRGRKLGGKSNMGDVSYNWFVDGMMLH
jgi:hypothetical protein